MRPVDAGPLTSARVLEQLGVLLLRLNRRYKRKDLGITVAGLPDER
jgi:predicted dinucleotide-binding enzyme